MVSVDMQEIRKTTHCIRRIWWHVWRLVHVWRRVLSASTRSFVSGGGLLYSRIELHPQYLADLHTLKQSSC